MRYRIIFGNEAREHLRALSAADRRRVLDGVEVALRAEPTKAARNRKELRPNPLARWKLRVGELRVFYDVPEGTEEVVVLGIGRKVGNRLLLGGREYVI